MELKYIPVEQRPKSICCDIDGCIFKHSWPEMAVDPKDDVLPGVVRRFAEWYTNGDKIILMTARPWAYKGKTEWQLREAGILYHELIMGLPTGMRILINDRKPQQGEKDTALAVNLVRDEGFESINF